jgi:predicted exporter
MSLACSRIRRARLPRRKAAGAVRLAVALWLAFVLACAVIAARTTFTADLSAFLPRAPTAEQQLLVDQLRDGLVSRLILAGIEGGTPAGRAALSTRVAATLRGDVQFAAVSNGEPVNRDHDQRYLFSHRYLLSPAVDTAHFSENGLKTAIGDSLDLLASPAGLFTKALLPRDPTGEMATLLGQFDGNGAVRMRDGVWASRDGERAVLLLQTAASGSDTDAQARAMAAIRKAFDAAKTTSAGAAQTGADYHLVMTGPGVISVNTRDTIKRQVERLSALGVTLIVAMLWFVYRSVPALILGLVPVLSGALAGVAAVSLGFGAVHGITLGFGTTLIGEAVDYAIYLFAQSSHRHDAPPGDGADARNARTARTTSQRAWLAAFWPTVRLGVLTSIFGFASLLLSGFPGLAQLGLYSIAGLATAALVTRFVLPHLVPESFRMRDMRPLGRRLIALAALAPRLRWPVALLLLAACAVLATRQTPLWSQSLSSLSPVPASEQALDTRLRADVGAPDVRYLVVISAADPQTVLRDAERAAQALAPLVDQGVISGFESPARYLPSEAAQRARQAALPPREELQARLQAAVSGLPVKPGLFGPFLDDVDAARKQPVLTRDDLRGTSMALAVDGLLTRRGDTWSATLPLRAPQAKPGAPHAAGNADANVNANAAPHAATNAATNAAARPSLDAAPIRAAIDGAGLSDVMFVDLKRESDQMYGSYLREALHLSLAGLAAIVLLLLAALRSPRRVVATLVPLAAAALLVMAALAASGMALTLLHLVGLLLLVAVGSNYALFFNNAARAARTTDRSAPSASGIAPDTIVSLVLANATAVAGFGLLAFSSLPMLQAFGLTVGPGAVLALILSAVFAPAAPSSPAVPELANARTVANDPARMSP